MYYIIKRELEPLDGSINEVTIKANPYDIVKSPKNTGLDTISDYVVDDNLVLIRYPQGEGESIAEALRSQTGLDVSLLLLG